MAVCTLAIIMLVLTTVCASAAEKAKAPREFVTQILEPTGGKIQRPKGWFYTERHSLPSLYTWILSREDASKGPYTTAVRIETIVGVHEGSGKTPKQFVLDYMQFGDNSLVWFGACWSNSALGAAFAAACKIAGLDKGKGDWFVWKDLGTTCPSH